MSLQSVDFRQFFHALAFYRSGTNTETATRHLAAVLKELHTDPLLTKMFGRKAAPEIFYIEWVRALRTRRRVLEIEVNASFRYASI